MVQYKSYVAFIDAQSKSFKTSTSDSNLKANWAPPTYCGTDNFNVAFPPLYMQAFFFTIFLLCVVYSCPNLPFTLFIELLGNGFGILRPLLR